MFKFVCLACVVCALSACSQSPSSPSVVVAPVQSLADTALTIKPADWACLTGSCDDYQGQ